MQLNEYQAEASKTANLRRSVNERRLNWALGIAGEAGEIADVVKKFTFHGHPIDLEALAIELGDLLWYVSQLASDLGYTLEDIARMNLSKLAKRYPKGFTSYHSLYRTE